MLSGEEIKEIETEIPNYADRRAVCIDALKIVQRHRGWVSDGALRDLADFLEMSTDELDGVATFYNLIFRKPVGRHVIFVCDSVSCWIMGAERLREALQARLDAKPGGSTADGRFTLLPNVCLGACDHAPVLMVDDELFGDVDPEALERLLEAYR